MQLGKKKKSKAYRLERKTLRQSLFIDNIAMKIKKKVFETLDKTKSKNQRKKNLINSAKLKRHSSKDTIQEIKRQVRE